VNSNCTIESVHRDELDLWLWKALWSCSPSTRERVSREVRGHYESAVARFLDEGISDRAAHRATMNSLGSAKAYSRHCLTHRQEARLAWMANPLAGWRGFVHGAIAFLAVACAAYIAWLAYTLGVQAGRPILIELFWLSGAMFLLGIIFIALPLSAKRFGGAGVCIASVLGGSLFQLCLSIMVVRLGLIEPLTGAALVLGQAAFSVAGNTPFILLHLKLRRIGTRDKTNE